MGYEPENTLLSFKKAIKLGVDMIELDVHLCKSGELVVIRDKKVDRTTNGRGLISKKTRTELKKLNAGKRQKIPLLSEVIDLVNKKIKINIEIKDKQAIPLVNQIIVDSVKKRWNYSHFLVSSFSQNILLKLKKINSKIRLGIIVSRSPVRIARYSKLGFYSVHLKKNIVNKKRVMKSHEKKLKVYVWTLDDIDKIKKVKSLGVDGIFSNYPDRI